MSKQPVPFDPNTADADSVRLWLQASLDSYFEQNMGRWAFPPLEHYVGVRDDLAEDLRAIYQDVEPHAQVRWRTAIRDLLAIQGRDLSKRDTTRALIDFAALIRAHEVLDVLPALVSCDPESLLDPIVETAVALANQTAHARDCLQRLHTSPSFSEDYAGLVLVALCHVDPDGWLRHVENLARAMNVLASRLEDGSTALRSFASDILEAISLSRLDRENLNHLARSSESTWLWKEWLGNPPSLLRYEAAKGLDPRLSLWDDNAQSIKLDGPLEALGPSNFRNVEHFEDTVTIVLFPGEAKEVWIATFQERRITELTLQSSHSGAIAWLKAFFGTFPHIDTASLRHMPELTERRVFACITLHPSNGASTHRVRNIDPATPLSDLPPNNTTRITSFYQYRDKISSTHRRVAMRSQPASEAARRAIDLAQEAPQAA